MARRNSNGQGTTKKITCPNQRCQTKNEVKMGNRDNGDGDTWSGTKEIKCCNPICGRMIKFKVNRHNKIKIVI